MPYDIELLDKDGKRYEVPEHRFSYRWEPDAVFESGKPNRTTESVVQFSNMDDVCRFECLAPFHSKRDHRIVGWPIADAARDLDEGLFDDEQSVVPDMLKQWAREHPDGVWRAL